MSRQPRARTRSIPVVAQDPSVLIDGQVLIADATVPEETLDAGPSGARVRVIDFDSTTGRRYLPAAPLCVVHDGGVDPSSLRTDVGFHQHNVYAVVMSVLARFEHALGRRVPWGFLGHTITVSPHAFEDANAFYAPSQGALLFGYFPDPRPGRADPVFTCLSHDIVAHETSHALLDGLRPRFSLPSCTDQAAFHEGFSDVVALLSAFSHGTVVHHAFDGRVGDEDEIVVGDLSRDGLRKSILMVLGEQMGKALVHGDGLRTSASLNPEDVDLADPAFGEPHRRGEVFVAAVMNAFLDVWLERLAPLLRFATVARRRVVEEGTKAADRLLAILIRALDYTPPVELSFGDYLSALITADAELWPDDTTYGFRDILRRTFFAYGVAPSSVGGTEEGAWAPPPAALDYENVHAEALRTEPDEIFRFLWQNRVVLGFLPQATREVLSVRPCVRVGTDGFVLRETVSEVVETLTLRAEELPSVGLTIPEGMPEDFEVTLYGGRTLVFDEFSHLRFDIGNGITGPAQDARLARMWRMGMLVGEPREHAASFFRNLHLDARRRAGEQPAERW